MLVPLPDDIDDLPETSVNLRFCHVSQLVMPDYYKNIMPVHCDVIHQHCINYGVDHCITSCLYQPLGIISVK